VFIGPNFAAPEEFLEECLGSHKPLLSFALDSKMYNFHSMSKNGFFDKHNLTTNAFSVIGLTIFYPLFSTGNLS